MSKISLEPNASGAGTFTLAAPNINTNRTLTLPDEAGKLLSTGNDNPAEVFKQSNILGTVSESGGVPTGAIIERGSNSNGEFVKYADGTMICTGIIDSNDYETEGTDEFLTSRKKIIAFPSSFINTDYVMSGNILHSSTRWRTRWIAGFGEPNTSSIGVTQITFSPFSALVSTYTAIGRWY